MKNLSYLASSRRPDQNIDFDICMLRNMKYAKRECYTIHNHNHIIKSISE